MILGTMLPKNLTYAGIASQAAVLVAEHDVIIMKALIKSLTTRTMEMIPFVKLMA